MKIEPGPGWIGLVEIGSSRLGEVRKVKQDPECCNWLFGWVRLRRLHQV